ncbi:MAG: DMT family transporter [Anaerolineaceae bacterium]|nr:DMT family transporter [Anaerolineaceae bacterium]
MGEFAAFLVAICWALTSVFFAAAGNQVGSLVVNRMRLLFASVLLIAAHLVLTGQAFPWQAEPERWLWLGLSGIIGLVLGDAFLFQAFVQIGARISILIMASVPVISALIAWLFLGERLAWLEFGGIFITVTGIALVVYDHQNGSHANRPENKKVYFQGIFFAFLGAIGQSVGLVLQKKGGGDFPAISSVLIRVSLAAITLWSIALLQKKAKFSLLQCFGNKTVLRSIAMGTLVGPFAGIWLSMVAVQAAYVGIASTLMALTPIIMLPIAFFVYKEKISKMALIGTFVSLAGVAIIFLLG